MLLTIPHTVTNDLCQAQQLLHFGGKTKSLWDS